MITLRLALWAVLSAFMLAMAFVLVAVSRQIAALDHGWINAVVILGLWIGLAITLKRTLLTKDGGEPVALDRRMTVSTLHARRG